MADNTEHPVCLQPAKIVSRRLRVKTPTLKRGKYAGRSVSAVLQDDSRYWRQHVHKYPVEFLGSLRVFEEFDAKLHARIQMQRQRELMESNATIIAARQQKPPDYIYTGDEIILRCK